MEAISGSPLVCRPLLDMQEQHSPMVMKSESYLQLYKDLTQAEELKTKQTKQLSVLRRKCKPGEQRQQIWCAHGPLLSLFLLPLKGDPDCGIQSWLPNIRRGKNWSVVPFPIYICPGALKCYLPEWEGILFAQHPIPMLFLAPLTCQCDATWSPTFCATSVINSWGFLQPSISQPSLQHQDLLWFLDLL